MTTPADLTVVEGGCRERLAFSLVHPRGRIDIPARALISAEVQADELLRFYANEPSTESVLVAISVAPSFGAQIFNVTRDLVGEPIAVVIGQEIASCPIVREPFGNKFNITLYGWAEAKALAQTMRVGWHRPELQVVPREA